MTDTRTSEITGPAGQRPVMAGLPVLDRFLPVWIGAAMVAGLLLGRVVRGLNGVLNRVAVHGTSLPIALGLLLMMYPVLAKVRYTEIGRITADRRMMTASLVLNWVIGPAVMFALAWLLLPDQPAYRTGVILVGLARCIAMVLIWTDLASGDREMATVLVALNAVFQVLLYAVLGFFYLQVLPGWLGLPTTSWHVSIAEIAGTVAVFLGIPLVAGYLTRTIGERARGRDWYENQFLPRLGPVALYGLLFTVVILFALQGKKITSEPLDVARIALPLLAYFAIMWLAGFAVSRRLRLSYPRTVSLAFSAASNDYEAAGDRRGDRRVRGDQRAGAGQRGRAAHRGAGHARAGLRRAVGPPPLLPCRGGNPVNCFDCAALGQQAPAVAVCADCGAAVCHDHAQVTARWLTRTMAINRTVAIEPPARTIRCGVCQAARDTTPTAGYRAASSAMTTGSAATPAGPG